MDISEKYQFICDTVKKCNPGQNPSYVEVSTALSYFRELIDNKQYPDDGLNPRIAGSTLADALKKVTRNK